MFAFAHTLFAPSMALALVILGFQLAAASGVDEDELHDEHEFVEHSSVEEVMAWCTNSG